MSREGFQEEVILSRAEELEGRAETKAYRLAIYNRPYGDHCTPATILGPEERVWGQPQPVKAEPSESKLERSLAIRALQSPIKGRGLGAGSVGECVWLQPGWGLGLFNL